MRSDDAERLGLICFGAVPRHLGGRVNCSWSHLLVATVCEMSSVSLLPSSVFPPLSSFPPLSLPSLSPFLATLTSGLHTQENKCACVCT